MTQPRVLIVLTSHAQKGSTGQPTGAYVAEIAHPLEVFRAAGWAVDFASVRGGRVPLDGTDDRDRAVQALLADAPTLAAIHAGGAVRDVDVAAYDAVFLAGGHGTMWDFPDDPGVVRVVGAAYDRGAVVGAVCHGPAGLVNVRLASGAYLVADKPVAAFTNAEEAAVGLTDVVPFLLHDQLAARGARPQPAANWAKQVVVADRLVTGQNPASARGVAEAMVATATATAPAARA